MLEDIGVTAIFHFLLLMGRFGSAMLVLPGYSEIYVTQRSRLVLSLSICFLLYPIISPILPDIPSGGVIALFLIVMSEVMVGLFIGAMIRMVQSVLHTGGMIIAFQSSLASALLFDANQGSQGSVIGNFMTLVGVTLLFATNLHHYMIAALVESYDVFSVGVIPPTGDMAEMAVKTLSGCFLIAFKISSPLVVIGLCVYLGSGILGRLMPQMQVFMIMVPAQIYVSFTIFVMSLSVGMLWYLQYFREVVTIFSGGL